MTDGRPDSYLKCTVCGRESTTSFASSLRTGWEKCCGYTMRLIRTDADIEAAVGRCFGSVRDAIGIARGEASESPHGKETRTR